MHGARAPSAIYTLSLHDALPICLEGGELAGGAVRVSFRAKASPASPPPWLSVNGGGRRAAEVEPTRSEEHTSELQSRQYLVCRLLLEQKKVPTQPVS